MSIVARATGIARDHFSANGASRPVARCKETPRKPGATTASSALLFAVAGNGFCRPAGLSPEGVVKLSRPLAVLGYVAVADTPGDGGEQDPLEQRLSVVGLDRGGALLAGEQVPLGGRIPPAFERGSAEVAGLLN